MRNLFLILFFGSTIFTAAAQSPVIFYCNKMEIGDINTNELESRLVDIKVIVAAESNKIAVAFWNENLKKYDVLTRTFHRSNSKDQTKTFYIDDKDGSAIVTIFFDKSEIFIVDVTLNQIMKLRYEKFEIKKSE